MHDVTRCNFLLGSLRRRRVETAGEGERRASKLGPEPLSTELPSVVALVANFDGSGDRREEFFCWAFESSCRTRLDFWDWACGTLYPLIGQISHPSMTL